MKKRLKKTLTEMFSAADAADVYSSFDIIGDIAIIKLPKHSQANAQNVAEAIMHRHKNVKAVFTQTSAVTGAFRLRKLAYVAGENRTSTVHRESSCAFAVDVKSCYFSPRLSHERMRIAHLVQAGEKVVNMFAGAGCFSIVIAKHAQPAKVFSIDVNPTAVEFMKENVRRNRVYGIVIPLLGDAKAVVEARLKYCADRVLMPLPEKAFEYLPCAVSALKTSGGWIHIHAFEHALKTENASEKVRQKIVEALDSLKVSFGVPQVRVVRPTGPNWYQLVADVHVNRRSVSLGYSFL
ncbi:MAG: class I SAM-dependent methyltransferase family protein [Candidatus Bathyarchaeota archaeon]|nr:class I SAM-dependent methyltransferase family protein [Candidatus Bathyarchaeota archaeon]